MQQMDVLGQERGRGGIEGRTGKMPTSLRLVPPGEVRGQTGTNTGAPGEMQARQLRQLWEAGDT